MSEIFDGIINIFKFDHFYDFIIQNGIVSTTAAVVIAYSAWDFIKSFVGDLFLPAFYFTFIFPFVGEKSQFHSTFFAPIEKMDIPNFLKNTISFFIVVIITYFLFQNIIMNFIKKPIINTPVVSPTPDQQNSETNTHVPETKPTTPYFIANPFLNQLNDVRIAKPQEIIRIGH